MKTSQLEQIRQSVKESLDKSEAIWDEFGDEFRRTHGVKLAMFLEAAAFTSPIPGHRIVTDKKPSVDNFIALVADMRQSTDHMLHAIGGGCPSLFQRVFYETSALLPALGMSIEAENGSVTEYLGDGLLALFGTNTDLDGSIYKSYRAAKNCMQSLNKVVNPILKTRYGLPPIQIGVGLAYSTAIITLVGTSKFMQPKAVGECIYRASKFSGGNNIIGVDPSLRRMWPKGDKPTISFKEFSCRGEKGFKIIPV